MNEQTKRVCEKCGKPLFFGHSIASSTDTPGVWRYYHHDCECTAEVLDALPAIYDLAIEANVRVEEMIGRFTSERDDGEWNDPKALQRLLLDAYHTASEGVRSESRWRGALR